jgi:S-adenosylmethionine hydrolase
MAPAAAHLAAGLPIGVLGDEVDVASLSPGIVPLPKEEDDGTIVGEVLWVDRYGNCQLNVAPEMLQASGVGAGDSVEVHVGDTARRARWVHTFADAKPRELVLIVDSYGMCALALDRASAAAELSLRPGRGVTVVPPSARRGQP